MDNNNENFTLESEWKNGLVLNWDYGITGFAPE